MGDDSKAKTLDCSICGEKHGDPVVYLGQEFYACPKVPNDGTIYQVEDLMRSIRIADARLTSSGPEPSEAETSYPSPSDEHTLQHPPER